MRVAAWLLALCVLLLVACIPPRRALQTGGNQDQPSSASLDQHSPWLDPEAQIQRRIRLITTRSFDLRQALYLRSSAASGVRIMLRLRDYSVRAEGQCDPQAVSILDPATGRADPVLNDAQLLPVNCLSSYDELHFSITALRHEEQAKPADAPLQLILQADGAAPQSIALNEKAWPLGYADSKYLFCRKVTAMQLEGGLPAPALDWSNPGLVCGLRDGKLSAAVNPGFASTAEGSAGYVIQADPSLPANAQINYSASALSQGQRHEQQWSMPYHVSYSAFAWMPPLEWAAPETLVTVAFRPDALGESAREHYLGLFRMVALNVGSGTTTLIEDRLPPYLPIAAGGNVVFYTTKQVDKEGAERWELWASSLDGLDKQLLYTTDDALYLSVEDQTQGRRLLVHRQYMSWLGGAAELHSELLEFSLDPLEGQDASLSLPEGVSVATPSGDVAPAPPGPNAGLEPDSDSGGSPPPPSSGDGPPPIAIPQ